jgi:hypothetical protein
MVMEKQIQILAVRFSGIAIVHLSQAADRIQKDPVIERWPGFLLPKRGKGVNRLVHPARIGKIKNAINPDGVKGLSR